MLDSLLRPAPRRHHRTRHAGAGGRAGERGLTLIEVTIALLIVGLLVFVAIPSIEALVGVRAREEAGRISGAIRYMYGQSALTGKPCRMVFDLDARKYWAECTEDRFTVALDKESSRDGQAVVDEPSSWSREPADPLDEGLALRQQVEKEAEFSSFTSSEITERSMPDGANLAVWTAHQTEKYTAGKAYLHFFPQGNTEKAHIYVSSDHGDVYTLVVSALSGKVRVVNEELELPRK